MWYQKMGNMEGNLTGDIHTCNSERKNVWHKFSKGMDRD